MGTMPHSVQLPLGTGTPFSVKMEPTESYWVRKNRMASKPRPFPSPE